MSSILEPLCQLWTLLDLVETEGRWNVEMAAQAYQMSSIAQDQANSLIRQVEAVTGAHFWRSPNQ